MDPKTQEVLSVVSAFADAWNRHDMAAFAELFAADAEFVNVVGTWWKGKDAIRKAHEFIHASMFRHSRLGILATQVRFPVERIAIARSTWSMQGHVGPDGAKLPGRTGVLVHVLLKSGDRWQIIDSQNTDIVEGAASRPQ